MVCAGYITTGFVVLSVGAWLIRKGQKRAKAVCGVAVRGTAFLNAAGRRRA